MNTLTKLFLNLCVRVENIASIHLVELTCIMEPPVSKLELINLAKSISCIHKRAANISLELEKLGMDLLNITQSESFSKALILVSQIKNMDKAPNKRDADPTEDTVQTSSSKRIKINCMETRSISEPQYNYCLDGKHVVVYTDGACENNGRSNAKAGVGVWFANEHPLNISKPVDGKATNNTAEIQACISAVEVALLHGIKNLKIKTDSQFTINCMTKWIHKWKKNDWKVASGADVKNKEDLIKLDRACSKLDSVEWVYVRGHMGEEGNEQADKLARQGALHYKN